MRHRHDLTRAISLFVLPSVLSLRCLAQPLSTAPATGPASRPAVVRIDPLDQILIDTNSDDPDVRAQAQAAVKNLPAEAYEAARARIEKEDLPPESAIALQGALKVLGVRHRKYARTRADREWVSKQLSEAYETIGRRDPAWDASVRQAFATPADGIVEEERERVARRIAALVKAIDAGCTDPLVVRTHISLLLDARRAEVHASVDWHTHPDLGIPEAGMKLPPGTLERVWAAVDETQRGPYVPRFKCQASQALARLLLAVGGDRNQVGRYLALALETLPAALATPGLPAEPQYGLIYEQYTLSQWHAPKQDREAAIGKLYELFAAAAPGPSVPLLFKGDSYANWATDLKVAARPAELSPQQQAEYRDHNDAAAAALEAAWKIDPTDPRISSDMLAIQFDGGRGPEARRGIELWFARAIDSDPDNLDACQRKMHYLLPTAYGSAEDTLEFGRQCRQTDNFRGRVAFMLAEAHLALAEASGDRAAYLRRADVWEDVRETYEASFRVFPESVRDRSKFAWLAGLAGQSEAAAQQFDRLGERGDTSLWGGQAGYDFARLEAARLAAGDARVATTQPAPDGAFEKALEAAATANLHGQDFNAALRSVAAHFSELRVGKQGGTTEWQKVTLNTRGKRIDCVRFRAPEGRPADMRWAFATGKNRVDEWYIIRADAKNMRGFQNFDLYRDNNRGIPAPGDGGKHDGYVQSLAAPNLEPGAEYLIWFRFRDVNPVRTTMGITFVPPAGRDPTWKESLKDLGLGK